MTSLFHAGLMDRQTRLADYDADSVARWAAWEQQNNIQPNGPQEIHKGDLKIGINELLLTDKDLLELQEAAAIACSTRAGYHDRRYRGLQNHGARDTCECDENDSFDYDNYRGPEQKVQKKVEFLGNGGCYCGRWYSRAALVFWPRSHRPDVLAQSSSDVHNGEHFGVGSYYDHYVR